MNDSKKLETAYFGGGCFWCLDAVYSNVIGVESVICGYAGGTKQNPTYEEVSTGATGHAEVVKITYNPDVIKYEDLLHILFTIHNPTSVNRQGSDIGPQYRSIILYADNTHLQAAENIIKELVDGKVYNKPLVTELVPLKEFWEAEEYHQKYFDKNPDKTYCALVIAPKLAKFKEKYKKFYRQRA